MSSNTLRHIAISKENYFALKSLGQAGDSFNDVITEVLKKVGTTKLKELVGSID